MKEYTLKYGCNPNQQPARVFMQEGELPIEILSGRAGYINLLDALNGWQLVRELSIATNNCAAASFKHVSPTSAAIGKPLDEKLARACFVSEVQEVNQSPLACAYARARGADRMSSFGDFVALSHTCDLTTAKLIAREVSDGVIAPNFSAQALSVLQAKRGGNYTIIKIDEKYTPNPIETKQVFGVTFEQRRNDCVISPQLFTNVVTKRQLDSCALQDLTVALITLKYTQSNSVCYAIQGQAIGVGAGQQSRIHCTRLAGNKADLWQLRQHDKVLHLPFIKGLSRADKNNIIDIYLSAEHAKVTGSSWHKYFSVAPPVLTVREKSRFLAEVKGVSLGSDAFFPFYDNIERAKASGVEYIAQAGGSLRDNEIIKRCNQLNIAMCLTGLRLFHH